MLKRLLLLLGPSGVGKTTLIDEIVRIDQAFSPVTAFTTRPPRPGDRYRTCVSDHEFKELEQTETLLALNNIYGYRYGTAKRTLLDILQRSFAPIMDCPLAKLHTVEQAFPGRCSGSMSGRHRMKCSGTDSKMDVIRRTSASRQPAKSFRLCRAAPMTNT